MPEGALEANTRNCVDIHIRHFERDLGRPLSLLEIGPVKPQEYVNKRAKAKGRRGMPLRPETIKKGLSTLTAIWNWALRAKHVNAPLEKYGLRFPKSPQKPPFQTFADVTRKCKLLGLSQEDRDQLWDSVLKNCCPTSASVAGIRSFTRREQRALPPRAKNRWDRLPAGYRSIWVGKTHVTTGSSYTKFAFDEGVFTPGEPEARVSPFAIDSRSGETSDGCCSRCTAIVNSIEFQTHDPIGQIFTHIELQRIPPFTIQSL